MRAVRGVSRKLGFWGETGPTSRRGVRRYLQHLVLFLILAAAHVVRAQLPVESIGQVETLPEPLSGSWVWASDPVLERVSLLDFEMNRVMGSVDGGWGITVPLFPLRKKQEFYVPETHYSRGNRGERTDIISIYDTATLSPVAEIVIPAKRAQNSLPIGNAALTDDEQFLAVFNMSPAQSVSIVDVENRQFVEEIPTPGCSLAYGAGERRIMMFCADGALLFITLDGDGHLRMKQRSQKFFDPQADPVTEKGVRVGSTWYFVSFEGAVHAIDIATRSVDAPAVFSAPWSLINGRERAQHWRVGGRQFIAVHEFSQTLYVLMHRGEVDTHKTGGTHIWTFDIKRQKKISEYELVSPGFTFSGVPTEFGTDWVWPFNKLYNLLTRLSFEEPLARPDAIVVSQSDDPVLLLGGQFSGMLAVYDASNMRFRHRVTTGNYSNLALQLPGWGDR